MNKTHKSENNMNLADIVGKINNVQDELRGKAMLKLPENTNNYSVKFLKMTTPVVLSAKFTVGNRIID
jgi:hypothetical protein